MSIHYRDERVTLHHGDCLDVLRGLPDASVDSVVCDPPYGLANTDPAHVAETITRWVNGERDYLPGGSGFMGAAWDAFVPPVAVWDECLRVLKPGGHVLTFAGSRTVDLMTLGLRLAGFDIRDSIAWLYGSGFPKSLDVSKAIDKAADYRLQAAVRRAAVAAVESAGLTLPGNSRHDWTVGEHAPGDKWWAEFQQWLPGLTDEDRERVEGEIIATIRKTAGWFTRGDIYDVTAPATPDAERWQGWGSAMKPAFEPVVVARKPLIGTVAQNVLTHGTGALNIDGCRVGDGEDRTSGGNQGSAPQPMSWGQATGRERPTGGRWPTNVVLDDSQAAELDRQSGERPAGARPGSTAKAPKFNGSTYNGGKVYDGQIDEPRQLLDSGGASRFFPTFRYEAKAPASERPFYYRPTCECEDAWPTHTPSTVRATDGTTALASSSTSKSGSATTGDLSPTATRSTTSTATSSTTTPTTSSPSPRPTTSASTPAANSETATGGSRAAFAASSSPLAPVTGTSAVRGGRSTDDAARATSQGWSATSVCGECGAPTRREAHATVKPLDLMRWLVRLVTPPGGTVLDPFAGSGTTLEAALVEGFHAIGIEREADYLPLIMQRINRRRDPVAYIKAAGDDLGLFDLGDIS